MNLFVGWSAASVIVAIIGGLGIGASLALFPRLTRSHGAIPPAASAAGPFLLWGGAVFWIGQASEAIMAGDWDVSRTVGQSLLWVVLCIAVMVAATITLRHVDDRR